ncbi:MAG: TrmH family RNA methyltransferase [Spirochaetales bacterium]|nr:TrmH family RNA methyltransferase [Spirochaetales bacterium]
MIRLEKLKTLGKKTLLRKTVLLLRQMELDEASGIFPDTDYLAGLAELVENVTGDTGALNRACENLKTTLREGDPRRLARSIYLLRSVLQEYLGVSAGDWDFYHGDSAKLDASRRIILPWRVYLDDLRSPFNVGSIFRTADSFGVEKILISPLTADPLHRRAVRTAMGCTETLAWETARPETLLKAPGVFALELGGVPLEEFSFPPAGTMIIGSEELGVGPEALEAADKSLGRVSIPMQGTKGSLNVSVAFGIVMHAWWSSLNIKKPRNLRPRS